MIVTNKSLEKVISANNHPDTLLDIDFPYMDTEVYYEKLGGKFTFQDHIRSSRPAQKT